MHDVIFLGWQDDDKKKTAHAKMLDAIAIGPEPDGLRIEGRTYISRGVFYLGEMTR
jgi:hypothetical protein